VPFKGIGHNNIKLNITHIQLVFQLVSEMLQNQSWLVIKVFHTLLSISLSNF